MNRKLLSITIVFALSVNLCLSAAAATCTGGPDSMHCNSMQPADTSKIHLNQKPACCEPKLPTPCESKAFKSVNRHFVIRANGVATRFDEVAGTGGMIDPDSINSSSHRLNSTILPAPLISLAPIYLKNRSLII